MVIIEKPFGGELLLQLSKGKFEWPNSDRYERETIKLLAATFFVNRDRSLSQDFLAVFRFEF